MLSIENTFFLLFFIGGHCHNNISSTEVSKFGHSLESVKFCFFSRGAIFPEIISWNKSMSLDKIKCFDPSFETIILVHGFNDDMSGSVMIPLLKEAYDKKGDYNLMAVDWSALAKAPFYLTAAWYSYKVGLRLGQFLEALRQQRNLDLTRTEMIGFSLGAHIVGIASSISRVKRIIGLDPSEILFTASSPEFRLDPSDAPIVEVVHTSGGVIGFNRPVGNRDWYPNGGTFPQPGCSFFDLSCSHSRAYKYFAEAIKKNGTGWLGIACSSYEDYLKKKCPSGIKLALGNDNTNETISGKFYLQTNDMKPYGRKIKL